MNGTNDGGWIKLHRRFLRSAIWQNPKIARFWTWCLLKATHDGYTTTIGFKRITLEPGQFLYNHPTAVKETLLSQREVRSCLDFLKGGDDAEIGQEKGSLPGNRYSIITINKWGIYQGDNSDAGRQSGTNRASKRQPNVSLINKEGKNGKKKDAKIAPVDVTWTGDKLMVPAVLMEKYTAKYPRLDIASIIIDTERWLLKNPAKAAGYKSLDAFLNNWLRREQESRRKRDGDDSDYELTGDSLAAAQECANLFGRAVNE